MEAAADWLRREARTIRRPLVRAGVATALQALLLVAQAWLLADMLNAALLRHTRFVDLWLEWTLALAIVPLRFLLGVGARRITHAAALDLTSARRRAQLDAARHLGPMGLRAVASGDLVTRIVDGTETLLPYYSRYLPQAAAAVFVPLLLAIVVLPVDWLSAVVLILSAPLIPLFMVLIGGAAARASQRRFTQLQRLGESLMDALAGLTTLRQLGAAERVAARLDTVGQVYRHASMQVLRIAFLSSLVLEFLAMVSIAVVAVLIGFRLFWGELAFRQGLFVLLLAPEFYLPLRALGSLRHARLDAEAAADGIRALDDAGAPATAPAAGGRLRPPGTAPAVQLRGVHYGYPDRREVLCGLDLELAPRRITALVGASGSGKSTLLALLLGFAQPGSGCIRIDGLDLAQIELKAWRRRVAWLPQRGHVFEGSVADNLLSTQGAGMQAGIDSAARASGFDAVLSRLPQGWRTPLGEHGVGLSGGELQRLALTRVLARDEARLLLLDEPTAHLDSGAAAAVHEAIRAAAGSRTVLLVAHRLETVQLADEVAVMQDGRVVEHGAPATVARAGGPYSRLLATEGLR